MMVACAEVLMDDPILQGTVLPDAFLVATDIDGNDSSENELKSPAEPPSVAQLL